MHGNFCGKSLVSAIYLSEGDGPLALDAYKILQKVCPSFAQNHHPNLAAVARHLAAEGQGVTEAMHIRETTAKANPAIQWLLRKFNLGLGTYL